MENDLLFIIIIARKKWCNWRHRHSVITQKK